MQCNLPVTFLLIQRPQCIKRALFSLTWWWPAKGRYLPPSFGDSEAAADLMLAKVTAAPGKISSVQDSQVDWIFSVVADLLSSRLLLQSHLKSIPLCPPPLFCGKGQKGRYFCLGSDPALCPLLTSLPAKSLGRGWGRLSSCSAASGWISSHHKHPSSSREGPISSSHLPLCPRFGSRTLGTLLLQAPRVLLQAWQSPFSVQLLPAVAGCPCRFWRADGDS